MQNIVPEVSVVMITYGHENYIESAIEGVFAQKTDFLIELLIANDCSPDNSDSIIEKAIQNKPENIIVTYKRHQENIGMMPNFIWALENAKGKYIALCEGDDFWTDSKKMQIQYDFMESNEDFAMCFHPVEITMANDLDHYEYSIPQSDVLLTFDIVRNHYIPTCSLFLRNGYFINGLPPWFKNLISGDIPLEILLSTKGKTKYIDRKMACYSRNESGISQSSVQLSKMRKGYINMYSLLAKEVPFKSSLYLNYLVFRLRIGYLKAFFKRYV